MDAGALGELIAARGPGLVLYARQWTAAPEDAVQDAFLKLARQRTPPERVAAWLYRVVRNEAIDRARAEQRRQRHEARAGSRTARWFHVDDELDVDAVSAALARLPDEEREIIVMHLWGGLTFAEIATIVDAPTSSVHRWYAAGINRLRERLDVPCPKTEMR
jgi:RNA polymerase sigma factor (sigma-70 family)